MTNFIVAYFLIINISAFAVCGFDKYFSKNDMYRISEKFLITLCLMGGGAGFYAGMYTFRHKTRKNKFKIGVPVIIILWITALILIRRML